jgi:predicted RNase H-like HicB family nuclease
LPGTEPALLLFNKAVKLPASGKSLMLLEALNMNIPDYRYEIVMYWDDTRQIYVVEVPELPGCRAFGRNRTEALVNAEHAIEIWVDTARECGDPVPQPQGRMHFA